MEHNYFNELVTVLMKNGTTIQGIVCNTGLKWTLLKYVPNDYLLDGYVLINSHYISKIIRDDNDFFKEKILLLKYVKFELNTFFLDLNDTNYLLNDLREKKELISVELKNPEKNYVGNLVIIRDKSMRLHLIGKKCIWLKVETFLYNELRVIYFGNDYLNSLSLFLENTTNMVSGV